MKCVVYLCDHCNKNLSKPGKEIPHISVDFGNASGWVVPPTWQHRDCIWGIKQFCDGDCLGKFFNKLKKKDVKPASTTTGSTT